MKTQTLRQAVRYAVQRLLRLRPISAQDPGSAELRAMGDRELCDLAIGRGEIPYWLAQRPARRP